MVLETKSKAIQAALAEKAIADWNWEGIMEFVMMLMECFSTSGLFRQARKMGPAKKAALGVMIRRETGVRGRRKVNEIREVMLEELDSSSDSEMDQVWSEAKEAMGPFDFAVM